MRNKSLYFPSIFWKSTWIHVSIHSDISGDNNSWLQLGTRILGFQRERSKTSYTVSRQIKDRSKEFLYFNSIVWKWNSIMFLELEIRSFNRARVHDVRQYKWKQNKYLHFCSWMYFLIGNTGFRRNKCTVYMTVLKNVSAHGSVSGVRNLRFQQSEST